jgi:hypothetical protein
MEINLEDMTFGINLASYHSKQIINFYKDNSVSLSFYAKNLDLIRKAIQKYGKNERELRRHCRAFNNLNSKERKMYLSDID